MRVADIMTYDQVNRAIARNRSELEKYQNEAATQLRVTKPSDDPVAASQVLSDRTDEHATQQFIKNLNYAKSFLGYSAQSLGDLVNLLIRAKELAIGQANDGSSNPETRRSVAVEVQQLYDEAVQIGNRQLGDRFIFGGFDTTNPPFDHNGYYHGDNGEMKVNIDKDTFMAMNMPGSVAFLGKGLSPNGMTFKDLTQARTLSQLKAQETKDPAQFGKENSEDLNQPDLTTRAPASLTISDNVAPLEQTTPSANGTDIFNALKDFQIALSTNDRQGIQESIDNLGSALQQVIIARSALGSRMQAINSTLNSMHTHLIGDKGAISQLQDANVFHVVSNINKAQDALKATLETSGKILQKSLMDFVQT